MDDRYIDIPSGATYQYAGKDIPSEDSSGLPWTIKQNVSPNNADSQRLDAGAVFVLESKGTWFHAGFHLAASIASPTLLSLPFAFAGLGWGPGILALIAGGILSFYCYCLLSKVLEKCESQGHRYIRFRDLSRAVLGPKWSSLVIAPLQMLLCMGVVIRCILLAGECLKIIYQLYKPDGSLRLYYFIIVMGVVMLVLSQVPSFHALRYINLLSLVTCFGYTLCVVGGAIYAGHSKLAPVRDYSLATGLWTKTFNVFNSLSIIATAYGSGIIPEIQATIAPPTAGKMFKGLLSSYMVAIVCYFLIAISGYWAFGNRADGNIFNNFIGSQGSTLIPKWLLLLGIILVVMQLVALGSTYAQPAFELLEGKTSDINHGKFSMRNFLPRLILRSLVVMVSTLVAAMLPFFGDFLAFAGSFGFIPLDFIIPLIIYTIVFNLPRRSYMFWIHAIITILATVMGSLGCVSSTRQIILDARNYRLFANV